MSIEERITALKTSRHHVVVEQVDRDMEGVNKLNVFLQGCKGADRIEIAGRGSRTLFRDLAPKLFDSIMSNITTGVTLEIDMKLAELEKLVK